MQNNLAKDLLPHAIMLFVIDYAKRHEIKISDKRMTDVFGMIEEIFNALFDESEAVCK